MTAAERKVRERYPEACARRVIGGWFRIWRRPKYPRAPVLGNGQTRAQAWADAASRLPALENEQ